MMLFYTHLLSAVVAGSIAFTGGWKIQQARIEKNEKHYVEEAAQRQRELHVFEQKRSVNVIAAQNAAREFEISLRADLVATQSKLNRLRTSSTAALSFASTSLEACTLTTATYDQLLIDSAERYTELASKADRHVIDIKTLTEAWPD